MRTSDSKLLLLVGALCIIILLVVIFGFKVTKLVVNLGIIGVHLEPPTLSPPVASQPQFVRWGPVVDRDAGICLTYVSTDPSCDRFLPWTDLKYEVERKLLPRVTNIPEGSTVRLNDLGANRDWVMEIVDSNEHVVGNIWFGYNPLDAWNYDGHVRVGAPSAPATVWGTFQRYSDGSYH